MAWTNEQFIEKAISVHGDRYDYSLVNYVNTKTKVKIRCKTHGVFEQTPNSHTCEKASGCPTCGREKANSKITSNIESFVKKAKGIHGNKYDYSLSQYKNTYTDLKIKCPIHGVFEQTPHSHLKGRGCKLCGRKIAADKHYISTDKFIQHAKKIHGDLYDYGISNYKGWKNKVDIFCREHGVFSQKVGDHINGSGCRECGFNRGFDTSEPAILYYLNIVGTNIFKIGITNYSVEERFRNTDLSKLKIVKQWLYDKGEDALKIEKFILNHYKDFKYKGEKLLSNGNTELFNKDILGFVGSFS